MAKPNSAMETLRDLAQKEVEDAAIRLGTMRRAQQQADEQLNMLLNYQDEYRNKLNDNMLTGIASSRWTNYHQFIQTLEKAIEQHRHQLAQCNQKVEQALDVWRNKQQRLHAWETLQARSQANELLQENRLDQKRMDEYAQRASLRKGE
ncbi:flagellar export protein FliJ [Mixta calida]|uniref:flagellar export protein FliJ n=1 Tax=Mixta calida TaxID=665913 RepID=UPI0034D4ED04